MAFVRRMWSGKHHRTVKGIGLITLIWTDGTTVIPVDFRIYNIDEDDKTKNDHFRDMIDKLSLIHISEPTRLGMISYAVFCLKKKKKKKKKILLAPTQKQKTTCTLTTDKP